jgi:hypothetical protein
VDEHQRGKTITQQGSFGHDETVEPVQQAKERATETGEPVHPQEQDGIDERLSKV